MHSFLRRLSVFWIFFSLGLAGQAASMVDPTKDGGPERAEFSRAVRQLFLDEDFARLETMAEKLWQEKSRFSDGWWKLQLFHSAFSVSYTERARFDWDGCFARLRRWEEKFPQSLIAPVMHGWVMNAYAWEARGGGFANTVSSDGLKKFNERLHQTRVMLQDRPELKTRPGYYEVMITVALGEGWEKPAFDRLFAEAVAIAPDYEEIYCKRANSLQEKWYGGPGEWQKFAADSADSTKADLGMSLYTRIVWTIVGTKKIEAFRAAKIDWPRMRQGFEDLAHRYPDSLWNKNAYCYFAYAANDRETVRRLLEELEGKITPSLWPNPTYLNSVKLWAALPLPGSSDHDKK